MSRGRPSKRQHIIAVARQLFAEHGYQGTSIDQVVMAAGVSKPTVYNNFPTKLSLLQAMLDGLTEELVVSYERVSQGPESGLTGAIALYRSVLGCAEHLLVFRLALGESYKLDDEIEALLKRYMARLDEYRKALLMDGGLAIDETQHALLEAVFSRYLLQVTLVGDKPDLEGVKVLAHRVLQLV